MAPGIYRHYKGNFYFVLGTAIHTETKEEFVVYWKADNMSKIWIRPSYMFNEMVNGKPRFEYVGPR